MGCLFMLSDYVIYGGYRLWLDNDIIKDVWLDKNNFQAPNYMQTTMPFLYPYILYINILYYINILFYLP